MSTLRLVLISTFVNTIGAGVWLTCQTVFLLQYVGLSVSEVGVVAAAGALAGMVLGIPLGRLADRLGPRTASMVILSLEAIGAAGFIAVRSLWSAALVAMVLGALERGGSAARGALVVSLFAGDDRTRSRARVRSAQNLGIALGSGLGGLLLAATSTSVLLLAAAVNSATYLVSVGLTALLPRVAGTGPRVSRARYGALGDRPYLGVAAFNALMWLHYPLLTLLLPAYIVAIGAPQWLIAASILLNTALVVALQAPASRGSDQPLKAVRLIARAAMAVAAAAALFTAADQSSVVAIVTILAGVSVYTAAELWHSAASFGLGAELAPDSAQGEYQATFGTGISAARVVAPLALVPLVDRQDGRGWWLVAAGFICLAVATTVVLQPLVATAQKRLEPDTVTV